MAIPQNRIGYADIDALTVTFMYDGSIVFNDAEDGGSAQVGLAVTMTDDDTVGLVGDGEFVLGELIKVNDDGYCTVHMAGFVRLPAGTGASLTLGKKIVGDLLVAAKGYIQEMNTGTAGHNGVSRGAIVNKDDVNNVWVYLN